MKITLLALVGLFIFSACVQAVPSVPSQVIVENPTSTKNVESPTPKPSATPRLFQATYPTPTEWVETYPTKTALLIYSTSSRNQYTINFIEWGDFYPQPYMVLYEDGQLILGLAYEKHLSQADTQAIISKLEQLGLPRLQEAYETNRDSVYTVPPDTMYNPSSSVIDITFDMNGSKSITYRKDWEEHLIPPMKEIISYLNSISFIDATTYQPDRLLVAAGDPGRIPEGETIIPWPEDVISPLHRSYMGVFYLEGDEALKLYEAAGDTIPAYFSYEGKNYEVYLRPILPHECHTYHYFEVNLPPPAQPAFTCDDW